MFFLAISSGALGAATPQFSKEKIDRAMNLPLLRLGDPAALSAINYPWGSVGPAVHYLALVAYFNPNATTTGGAHVADRVVAHLNNVVASGNEPRLWGGAYAWNDHHLGGVIALARYTPAIWDRLSNDTKDRLTWLMKIGTYVGNLQHNAGNECYLTPLFSKQTAGGTAPNQANPMVAWMTYAYIFFGGAEPVNKILADFDHDTLVAVATKYGWKAILDWASLAENRRMFATGGYVEARNGTTFCRVQSNGIKAPFRFNGRTGTGDPKCPNWTVRPGAVPYTPFDLFKRSEYEWNLAAEVVDRACKPTSVTGETGHIKPGYQSPHIGKMGMFFEYNSNGRSSPSYVGIGRRISVFHLATMMATGFWSSGEAKYDEILKRLTTAMEVFKYRDANIAWYDPDERAYRSANAIFSGHDFVDDIWSAMANPKVTWTFDPVTSKGDIVPLLPPTSLRVD